MRLWLDPRHLDGPDRPAHDHYGSDQSGLFRVRLGRRGRAVERVRWAAVQLRDGDAMSEEQNTRAIYFLSTSAYRLDDVETEHTPVYCCPSCGRWRPWDDGGTDSEACDDCWSRHRLTSDE